MGYLQKMSQAPTSVFGHQQDPEKFSQALTHIEVKATEIKNTIEQLICMLDMQEKVPWYGTAIVYFVFFYSFVLCSLLFLDFLILGLSSSSALCCLLLRYCFVLLIFFFALFTVPAHKFLISFCAAKFILAFPGPKC